MSLNEKIAQANAEDKAFFDECFTHPVTRKPYVIPVDLRRLSERLCRSYGIRGICDPMYVANVIAFELGLGDGHSNFKETERVA